MKKRKPVAPGILLIGNNGENIKLLSNTISEQKIKSIECKAEDNIKDKLNSLKVFLVIFDIVDINKDVLSERIAEVVSLELPHIVISKQNEFDELYKSGIFNSSADFLIHPIKKGLLKSKVIGQRDLYERRQELLFAIEDLEIKKQKITEDKNKLKILTAAVSEPIIFVNQDLIVTFWNQEAQNVFGYSWYEAVSEDFLHWMVATKSHEQIKDIFQKVSKTGTKQLKRTQQFTMRNKLKVEIEVEATVSYHKIDDKEYNLVFVIHDRTKDKRLEKETQKSRELKEENKLIREFIKHIGMDIQTLLHVMLGISDTLRSFDAGNLNQRQIEGLNIINQRGTHMLELVKDLWDVSKFDSKKLKVSNEKFDFDKMLARHKSQTYQLIKDKSVKLLFKRSPSIPNELIGDSRKINQVLTELLANAVRYTDKGRIVLSSHFVENKLFIEITDNGKGIPGNIIKNLNTLTKDWPITDIKSSGAELGLHIAQKLIDLMKGELAIESVKGMGSVSRFFIPISTDVKPRQTGVVLSDISKDVISYGFVKDSKLILIVDDSPENVFIYRVLAEDPKYSILHVKNGKKAPAAIRDFAPDLLIIKMEMSGLHGASIVRELRNKLIKIPVIAVSQFSKLPNLAVYNVQLISEPLSIEILNNTIENKIRWFKKKSLKTLIVYEEESWIKKETNADIDIRFIDNKIPELSFIQISQLNPENLVFENVEKTSNSLPLLLRTISGLGPSNFRGIFLQYEGVPMKYLIQKIEEYPNIQILSKKDIVKLDIL